MIDGSSESQPGRRIRWAAEDHFQPPISSYRQLLMSTSGPRTRFLPDYRPLVLLSLGMGISLLHLLPELFFVPWQDGKDQAAHSPYYCWLTGDGVEEGLYRVDSPFLVPSALSSGMEGPVPDSGLSQPVAFRISADQSVEKVEPPAGLALFFFAPIAVNRADRELLMTISGIGPVLADGIIKLREKKGRFKEPRELLEVKGIGKARLAILADQLVFD